jgi:hypothetical protein
MMNKDVVKNVALPLTEVTTDELFTLLIGNKMVDIGNLKSFDPQAFRDTIKKGMNEHLGGEYVAEVMLEQLDYLSKDDVKASTSGQQKKTPKTVNIVTPAPAAENKPAAE